VAGYRGNLVHIRREPLQLSDVTIQPVLFTLLFVYVFGAGVVLPGGGSYTGFALTGLVIGWRPGASIPSVLAGFGLFLLFAYALSWACGCLGIVSKGPESAQGVGLVILFPLAIVSNGLVPTQRMPAVLRVIADWNPVAASLLWSVALLVIFAPLATLLYRRHTTG
jgi:ABC-type multidrug transport system permease subunit